MSPTGTGHPVGAGPGGAAALTGPGQPYELVEELVLGEPVRVLRDRPRSLRELLERSAAYGDGDYLIFGGARISYAEHRRRVAATSARLASTFGISKGDRVAVFAANCPEWVVTYWATVSLGGIVAAFNAWWTADEVAHAIDLCEPRLVVVDEARASRLPGAAGGAGPGARAGFEVVELGQATELFADPGEGGPGLPDVPLDEDDPVDIQFTSGTTGRAKGALHSHRNNLAMVASVQLRNAASGTPVTAGPAAPGSAVPGTLLCTSPLFHLTGLQAGVLLPLAGGMRTVWPTGRFDPAAVLELIERERCTTWMAPGTPVWRVVHHPDAEWRDLTSMRSVSVGAGAIAPELLTRIGEVFPSATASAGNSYGLTESTGVGTRATPRDAGGATSVGRPSPLIDVSVRDDDGETVADGVVGEICLRGASVMLGYWDQPDATAATFLPGRWLRTGDIGWLDDGELHLAARRTDLIVRGGENVYPTEVEQCLDRHPLVEESAVIGVAHPELGQQVEAVVVVAEGVELDPAELASWARGHLAYFKVPERWQVRTEPLPRTATGKVIHASLRAGAQRRSGADQR